MTAKTTNGPCEAVIVGAGIAGITCALKLQEAGVRYTVVSPDIGGRIVHEADTGMNYGAVFYMQGYTYAKQILAPAQKVLPSYFDLECHRTLGRGYGVASGPILGSAGQLLHFMGYLKNTFGPHYAAYKKACETTEVSQAIAADPYIDGLFRMTADEFIQREKFPKVAQALVSQFVHACTGASIHTLNALDYLVCAMGLVDTAMRFSFDPDETKRQLQAGGEVLVAKAEAVQRDDRSGKWIVACSDGSTLQAPNLVMAADAHETRRLIAPIVGDYEIRECSELHAYRVVGKVKDDYAHHALHLFDESIPLIEIGKHDDGSYEVFTCTPMDMGVFFDEFEVTRRVDWPHALYTHPSIVLDQCLGNGLYRCGDHNALGLEPSAISGVFVANKISGAA